ncbi:MAG: hypothetical protein PUD60_06815, partial [Akkermansia muciniphila]|nr:hypothetical protein [Akkermansia muciniphila]
MNPCLINVRSSGKGSGIPFQDQNVLTELTAKTSGVQAIQSRTENHFIIPVHLPHSSDSTLKGLSCQH